MIDEATHPCRLYDVSQSLWQRDTAAAVSCCHDVFSSRW